jgi:hypothetical protein
MQTTYTCRSEKNHIVFKNQSQDIEMSIPDFEKLIPRRQRQKIPMTSKMALALFKQYALDEKLITMGANPKNTPMIICNRYANWDFVSETMTPDIGLTLNNVNNYVATAWFPASIQGFLTIEYGNTGEAITLATDDKELLSATVESFLNNKNSPAIILGTFECFPKKIANQEILESHDFAFGAISIIPNHATTDSILPIINLHQGLYQQ